VMVAAGDPACVLGLLDPDSDLAETLTASGRGVVQLLQWRHRELAEVFAGLAPAPGGAFGRSSFTETAWGPRLTDATTWAGVVVADVREVGRSLLVTSTVEHLEVGEDDQPLVHRRGRYLRPSAEV
jgi:flavin reductase (DIM6/NTAB) family NADH-FMN oxidoreductase RutF